MAGPVVELPATAFRSAIVTARTADEKASPVKPGSETPGRPVVRMVMQSPQPICYIRPVSAPQDPSEGPTIDQPGPSGPLIPSAVHNPATTRPTLDSSVTSSTTDGSRFPSGTILADRYRIVSRLGKGGMGEVYRADDLKLGSSVALKFLPDAFAFDPLKLERFRSEVRLTREISHPNVCRVYDLAEVDSATGHHVFLSMEYVDGEDLSSLLKRIGRLPEDKAVQIARQICAGLHAAHELGVIHRDLKPANIMLDGRGNARIMDFGVAGVLSDLVAKGDIASGTPAYMAPEQLARQAVSKKSDIYSLGLVLYELFTGKPAYQVESMAQLRSSRESGTRPANPSDLVKTLDPAVERVILRCLEPDPAARPSSALAISAALPGGDPLAAALAAGETPSPELLALSGTEGTINPRLAWSMVGVLLVSLAIVAMMMDRLALHRIAGTPLPPEALVVKTHDALATIGVKPPDVSQAWGYRRDVDLLQDLLPSHSGGTPNALDASLGGIEALRSGSFPAFQFWFRSEPFDLRPEVWWQRSIDPDSPARNTPGSVYAVLSGAGGLVQFEQYPPDKPKVAAGPANWQAFFNAARLSFPDFEPVKPEWSPGVPADERFAWLGTDPNLPGIKFRVEAASLAGSPVSFQVIPPWRRPVVNTTTHEFERFANLGQLLLLLAGIIGASVMAWRNTKAGRSDRRGAIRLAVAIGLMQFLCMILPRYSIAALVDPADLGRPLARSLWMGAMVWLVYLGLEPQVRRRWPTLLISWTRLLQGRYRDPLLWRDVLIGLSVGGINGMLFAFATALEVRGGLSFQPLTPDLSPFIGTLFTLSQVCGIVAGTFAIPLLITLLMSGLERLLRLRSLFYPLTVLVLAILTGGLRPIVGAGGGFDDSAIAVFNAAVTIFLLVRCGLVTAVVVMLTATIVFNAPLTLDFSAWYAGAAIAYALPLLVLAGAGAYFATRGDPTPAL